ncbi:MAG TPA: adenylyltransferase/cytidyltransferase family protein [Anaerolineae bacterium]|nr:adenylyltransferase/cytidyltransferase family protein [Anaerolineae bacterium]
MGRIVSFSHAQEICQELRGKGKTVVFTNGVFDLLHVGHVRYLKAARELGDALFVGLNSDGSARGIKGPGRPLMPQAERAEVLCALISVDYVTIYEEPTAEQLVQALQPDIYAKGGDYAAAVSSTQQTSFPESWVVKPLPEARVVESYGGRVVILPYTADRSTSKIIASIPNAGAADEGG